MSSMARRSRDQQIKFSLVLPDHVTVSADSPRVGIVAFTPRFSNLKNFESRISVFVHEARHSDCPDGFDNQDCAYSHVICQSGDFVGEPACDSMAWGAYSVGWIYLREKISQYQEYSGDYRILEAMIFDIQSRIDEAALVEMNNEDSKPRLDSI